MLEPSGDRAIDEQVQSRPHRRDRGWTEEKQPLHAADRRIVGPGVLEIERDRRDIVAETAASRAGMDSGGERDTQHAKAADDLASNVSGGAGDEDGDQSRSRSMTHLRSQGRCRRRVSRGHESGSGR